MGRVNVYKWLVFAWAGHKARKLGRAIVRAKRLKKKATSRALVARYGDL